MNSRFSIPIAFASALLLSACASSAVYPDLATRDSERVSGTMAVPQEPRFVPAPPTPATIEQLDSLAEQARASHARFLSEAQNDRRQAENAAGAAPGTQSWSDAQVAIANLESMRSDAMIALADIDRLYAEAARQGGQLERLGAVQAEIAALIEEENRLIAAMLASLGS